MFRQSNSALYALKYGMQLSTHFTLSKFLIELCMHYNSCLPLVFLIDNGRFDMQYFWFSLLL